MIPADGSWRICYRDDCWGLNALTPSRGPAAEPLPYFDAPLDGKRARGPRFSTRRELACIYYHLRLEHSPTLEQRPPDVAEVLCTGRRQLFTGSTERAFWRQEPGLPDFLGHCLERGGAEPPAACSRSPGGRRRSRRCGTSRAGPTTTTAGLSREGQGHGTPRSRLP